MEYWEYLKYLYFSDASSAFTFAVAPFLWLASLFVARIKRPQVQIFWQKFPTLCAFRVPTAPHPDRRVPQLEAQAVKNSYKKSAIKIFSCCLF